MAFLKTDGDEMNKILYSYSPFDIDNAGNTRTIVVIYLTEGKPTSYTFSYEKPNVVYGYNISNIKTYNYSKSWRFRRFKKRI